MKPGRLNHIGVALKPLSFRSWPVSSPGRDQRANWVGVGAIGVALWPKCPTPLRLTSKLLSLTVPPLKRRREGLRPSMINIIMTL